MTNIQKLNNSFNLSKIIIKIFLISIAIFVAFVLFIQFTPTIAHAETPTNTTGNGGKPINVCGVISTCPTWIETFKNSSSNPETLAKSIVKFILLFVYFAIYVSAAIAAFFIVVSGYRYITSQGDDKNTKPALETLKNAVIGLVLAILSVTIVTFLGSFLTSFNF